MVMRTLITYATRATLRPAATVIEIFTGSGHAQTNAGDALAVLRDARDERREVDAFWAALSSEAAIPQPHSA
jgi:NAD(P)H-hydrate repair Nnr-like enzyme with NAD(P)H-hydrate epimerase domain